MFFGEVLHSSIHAAAAGWWYYQPNAKSFNFPILIYGLWRNEYPPFKINTALALTLENIVLNPLYPVIYLVSGIHCIYVVLVVDKLGVCACGWAIIH